MKEIFFERRPLMNVTADYLHDDVRHAHEHLPPPELVEAFSARDLRVRYTGRAHWSRKHKRLPTKLIKKDASTDG